MKFRLNTSEILSSRLYLMAGTALILAMAGTSVHAQDGDDITTVTIIANIEDPQSTFGSAYTLTPRELKKFESANVNSILRSVPGVYVREEDGLGAFPRIGIRASSTGRSDRIAVLEDGIPAAMAPYANTSAYYFPNIARISRIEVLKGPETLFYGPQTTSGAVNLISTPIPVQTTGYLKAEIGNYNTRRVHAWYGTTIGQWGLLFETYQGETDGYQHIDRSSRTAGNTVSEYLFKARWNSEDGRHQFDFKAQYGDEYQDVSYLGLTDADFRADPDRRYGLSERERMDRGRTGFVGRYRASLTEAVSLIATAYHTETSRHYTRLNQINGVGIGGSGITSIVNTDGTNAALLRGILHGTADTTHANGVRYGQNFQEFTSKGIQFELKGDFVTGDFSHDVTFGVRRHEDETRNVARHSNLIFQQRNGSLVFSHATPTTPSSGEAKATAVWLSDRINIGQWSLLPIVRYEDIETIGNVANPAAAQNSLSKTTLGLGVNYGLNANWTLLGGVYEGFAPPGSAAVQGTHGEESTNWEAGVRYRKGGLGFDAIGFYSDYSNALRTCLVANPCASGAIDGTEQSGSKEVYGLELGLFSDLYDSAALRVPVRLSYTWTDGEYTRASDVPTGVRKGDSLEYTPPHALRAQIGFEHVSGWNTYLALNYTAEACSNSTCDRPGVDSRFLKTESLFTVDASTAYGLTDRVEAYATIDNLFDERAITHRGSDGARGNPGRYTGVGLRVKY